MRKPIQQSTGFSNTPKSQASRRKHSLRSADHSTKEQLAAALINQGKHQEAEAIYKELIADGTSNHIVYGNLAALCGMQGKLDECINLLRKLLKLKPNHPGTYHNLGTALKGKGKLDAAITSYSKAIALNPNDPDTHYELGTAFKAKGDFHAAINSYKKALLLNPNFSEAHNNLGIALQERGDLTAAINSYKKALRLNPSFSDAHYNLGNTLQEQGNLTSAISSYKSALSLNPNFSEAHNNLGNALQGEGDLTAAINSYKNALSLNPEFSDAHYNLGNALQEGGDLTAAINSYKKALKIKPNDPDIHHNLGDALQDLGDLTGAIFHQQRALELDPNHSKSLYKIGLAQAAKGNIKDSKNSLHKAIELNPRNTAALFVLTMDFYSSEDSEELAQKLDKASRTGLSKKGQSMLEFALANFHHKKKEYLQASQHLKNANNLKLSFRASDLNNHLERAKEAAILARQINEGSSSDGAGMIFIVGAPRCGSTLLESVLTMNPNILDLGESTALSQSFYAIKDNTHTNLSLSAIYSEKTNTRAKGFTHSVDKNLYNYKFSEAIARALPAAKIVHCHRHPLDNILSMLRSNLQTGNNYTSDPSDAARFLVHQKQTINSLKSKYEDNIFSFDYDKFTSQPEKTLRPLINWLELDWKEAFLHPEESNRIINTASVVQARQPINNNSVGNWRKYKELLKPAEAILRDSGIFNL